MSVATYEGVVEGGVIRLAPNVVLPEKTNVYVVVPSSPAAVEEEPEKQTEFEVTIPRGKTLFMGGPRLRYPEQTADFALTMEETPDARVCPPVI